MTDDEIRLLRALIPARESAAPPHAAAAAVEAANAVPEWAVDLVDEAELIDV